MCCCFDGAHCCESTVGVRLDRFTSLNEDQHAPVDHHEKSTAESAFDSTATALGSNSNGDIDVGRTRPISISSSDGPAVNRTSSSSLYCCHPMSARDNILSEVSDSMFELVSSFL